MYVPLGTGAVGSREGGAVSVPLGTGAVASREGDSVSVPLGTGAVASREGDSVYVPLGTGAVESREGDSISISAPVESDGAFSAAALVALGSATSSSSTRDAFNLVSIGPNI